MSDWKIAADGSHTRHCTNPGCSYSESISHSLTHVAAKAATTKSEGNIEYWHCSICDKYFSDANAANEITEYSCAMKSHFRKFGNQMSGSGNHLYNYASLLA